jgi:shikimate dehydrogenase
MKDAFWLFIAGRGIGYTLSPAIYSYAFTKLGVSASYRVYDVDEAELRATVESCRVDARCLGFNVTKPYKLAIVRYLDHLDCYAHGVGAVNTVAKKGSELVGTNTDWYGVLASLQRFDPPAYYDTVLVIGAGGAARAVLYALRDRVKGAYIVSLSGTSARELAARVRVAYGLQAEGYKASPETYQELLKRVDLVVNASPASGPDVSPIPYEVLLSHLSSDQTVLDLVYNPPQTKLLRAAEMKGCRTIDGLWVLAYQAQRNIELWFIARLEADELREAAVKALQRST